VQGTILPHRLCSGTIPPVWVLHFSPRFESKALAFAQLLETVRLHRVGLEDGLDLLLCRARTLACRLEQISDFAVLVSHRLRHEPCRGTPKSVRMTRGYAEQTRQAQKKRHWAWSYSLTRTALYRTLSSTAWQC
jgi:hypothetical protein